MEFDCDVAGDDVDDGWHDDLDDHSDDQEGPQNAQQLGDGEEHDEDDADIDRPGEKGNITRKLILTMDHLNNDRIETKWVLFLT